MCVCVYIYTMESLAVWEPNSSVTLGFYRHNEIEPMSRIQTLNDSVWFFPFAQILLGSQDSCSSSFCYK